MSFFGQSLALQYPEAMLLINNRKLQIRKNHIRLNQSMCPNHQIYCTSLQVSIKLLLGGFFEGAS